MLGTFKLAHELRADTDDEPCGGILALAMDYERNCLLAGTRVTTCSYNLHVTSCKLHVTSYT